MDVRFINPFLYGTAEVMEKMAFIKPVAGKVFAKTDDTACGDISGIIGMTGDATGSLALTFNEECIIGIVGKMIGETHTEIDRAVLDAVGELTNIISGASRKMMEKDGIKVFAAIPTIVFGKAHTVRHIIKGPSIVIPFQTEFGEFVIDVCLKSNMKQKEEQSATEAVDPQIFNAKALNPAVFGKPSMPKAGPDILQDRIEKDLGKQTPVEHKNAAERLEFLRKALAETNATRDAIMKQMKEQPFMEWTQRQRYKKALPAYDSKIKRLKLDISAAETILKMSKDDLENPTIKPHFQHYASTSGQKKPGDKK
jgi:chemotaxis protein CheX